MGILALLGSAEWFGGWRLSCSGELFSCLRQLLMGSCGPCSAHGGPKVLGRVNQRRDNGTPGAGSRSKREHLRFQCASLWLVNGPTVLLV